MERILKNAPQLSEVNSEACYREHVTVNALLLYVKNVFLWSLHFAGNAKRKIQLNCHVKYTTLKPTKTETTESEVTDEVLYSSVQNNDRISILPYYINTSRVPNINPIKEKPNKLNELHACVQNVYI